MEQKTLTKAQAVLTIIGGFFVAAIIGGLFAQQVSDNTIVYAVRTILLLVWIVSIGFIWRMVKK